MIARMICSIGVIPGRERQVSDVRMGSKRRDKWENVSKCIYQLSETTDESLQKPTSPPCNHPHVFHCLGNGFSFLFWPNIKLAWREKEMENTEAVRKHLLVIPFQPILLNWLHFSPVTLPPREHKRWPCPELKQSWKKILRLEFVTSETDMGYDLSLTTAYIHTTCISICSHPIPPVTSGHKPRFWKQFYTKELFKRNKLTKRVYFLWAGYFKGKHKICSVVVVGFLNFSSFEPICPFQPNITVWNSPKCCVVFTALFIQDNMNATYKALENHVSEFCFTWNCQKVFVTHLWLHYTNMRYSTLT